MNKTYYEEKFAKLPIKVWRESEQREVWIVMRKYVEEHVVLNGQETVRKLYIEK